MWCGGMGGEGNGNGVLVFLGFSRRRKGTVRSGVAVQTVAMLLLILQWQPLGEKCPPNVSLCLETE